MSGGGGDSRQGVKSATLTIDGVFFVDGGFAGPDTLHGFERVTVDADLHLQLGRVARDGHERGLSADAIFAAIERVTGPDEGMPSPPRPGGTEDFAKSTRQSLAFRIATMRRMAQHGEDPVIYSLMSWADAAVPNFRRL